MKGLLRYPVVLDGRNLFSAKDMNSAGLSYYSVGRRPAEVAGNVSRTAPRPR
jgi:hypothetical protein